MKRKKERKRNVSSNCIASDNILKNLEDKKTLKRKKNSVNLSLGDKHTRKGKVIRGKLQSSGGNKDHKDQHRYENIKTPYFKPSSYFLYNTCDQCGTNGLCKSKLANSTYDKTLQ